jgi:DNA-binding beta-propeller fold protein YncE
MKKNILKSLALTAIVSLPAVAMAASLKQIAMLDVPGPLGKRFDYLKIGYKNHFLLSAHLGADQFYVIDLKTNKLIRTVTDTPGVEGIEYIEDLDKAYTSNWRDKSIGVIDMKQMKVIKKIPARAKPDGLVYAPPFGKVYVSDEQGKALIVIDVKSDTVVKTIEFSSETGMPQYDPIAQKVYLNLQDQNMFAVIEPKTDKVEDQFDTGKCKGNHGMALDVEGRLAFLGCEASNLLGVFDLKTHKLVSEIPLPEGVDVIAFDPGLQRIYAACYSGSISIIQKESATQFRKLEDFPLQPKVHSLAVDTETHRIYVPEQEENGKPASKLIVLDSVPQ